MSVADLVEHKFELVVTDRIFGDVILLGRREVVRRRELRINSNPNLIERIPQCVFDHGRDKSLKNTAA